MEECTKERDKRKDRNTKQKKEVVAGGETVGEERQNMRRKDIC